MSVVPMPAPASRGAADADPAAFLRLLRANAGDSVFEIRVPQCPDKPDSTYASTWSGYFDDEHLADAVDALAAVDARQKPAGVYVTLNPVNPTLHARAFNHLKAKAKATTSDGDIAHRRFLLIDIDPKRPAEISATDAEMELAVELARRMKRELCAEGWPGALGCMSGNGAYLIFGVDLPNDEASKALVRGVLDGLAARFDTPHVGVDRTTFNAARIVKVMGTHARKGDSIPERPHRVAKMLNTVERLNPVPIALLQAVVPADEPRRTTDLRPTSAGAASRDLHKQYDRFDATPQGVRGYLERHGVRVLREQEDGAYTQLVLEECPITGSEGGTSVAVRVHAAGAITYHNLHARAVGAADNWHALRDHLEPGYRDFVQRLRTQSAASPSARQEISIRPSPDVSVETPPPPTVETLRGEIAAALAWLPSHHGRAHIGIPTGRFRMIDDLLSGLHGTMVVAAQPGIGKTALFTDMGLATVQTHHDRAEPVVFVFFSFEMSRRQITLRLIARSTGIWFRRLVLGNSACSPDGDGLLFSREERDRYDEGVEALRMYQDRIVILDRTDIPVDPAGLRHPAEWLAARIAEAKERTGATRAFTLIDSLQTMPVYLDPSGQPWRSPLDEERFKMAEILKVTQAAGTYRDPVIVISEQSKAAMGKTEITAVLGSGRAVYSPDVVMFLKRADDEDVAGSSSIVSDTASVEIDLHIEKSRDGSRRGIVPLTFNYLTSHFMENESRRPVKARHAR